MDKQLRKIFLAFGVIMTVISAILIWRTVFEVIPAIGMEASALYLGMSIFFFCVGVGLIVYAKWSDRKDAKKAAEEAAKEQDQQ